MLNQLRTRLASAALLTAVAGTALIGIGAAHAEQGPQYSPNQISTIHWPWPIIDFRPDLTPTHVVADCEAGQLTIVWTTQNQGLTTAGTSFTYVALDGQVFSHLQDQPLAAGQGRQHSRVTTVSSLGHTVTVTVDAQHQVNESNEQNNSVTVPVTTQYGCS